MALLGGLAISLEKSPCRKCKAIEHNKDNNYNKENIVPYDNC